MCLFAAVCREHRLPLLPLQQFAALEGFAAVVHAAAGGAKGNNTSSSSSNTSSSSSSSELESNECVSCIEEDLLLSGSNKLQALRRIINYCLLKKEKVVVFSHSTKMLELVEELLLESAVAAARLDGGTPEEERKHIIQAFLRPPNVTLYTQ